MQKLLFIHNILVVALVGGVVSISASIHSQQDYRVDMMYSTMDPSEIAWNIADKTLSEPEVPIVQERNELTPSPESQAAPQRKEVPQSPFEQIINQAATTHQVDPALIKAIIMAESRYNPKAVSKRGARGLMQLMPVTAKSLGVEDSFDPEANINGGVMYFKRLLDRFDGNVEFALAAYNAGSRNVRKYGGVPPFIQTRTYIHKVFKYHQQYKQEVEEDDNVA